MDVQTEYTRLLNATKVSGRTDKNLGIGFLNAITAESYTTFTDADSNQQRELTEPLTNYNMLVLDQRFNRNSSVSFVNTNVWRSGPAYDANVAGLVSSFNFWEGHYQLDASYKRSDQSYADSTVSGQELQVRIGDVDGNWVWAIKEDVKTDTYDPNDMGFLQRNNLWKHYGEVEYRKLQPHGKLNRSTYKLYAVHQSLYASSRFESFYLGISPFWLDRNFNGFGSTITYNPVPSYDYFEPRTAGYFFQDGSEVFHIRLCEY
ncbi:MAG: DUF5916 domain-containing protein [Owenweeksia sp.]|nr:DUF5916 domain-containing protein [Owenweeksia sp.]